MKKLFLLFFCLTAVIVSKAQQTITFSEYFDYYYGYCPGDPQYDNWTNFRASLDTTADKFLKITMRGTFDMTGKSCSDKYAVRQIADALYNGYDATILCGNDYWYVGTGCSDYNCGSSSDYVELTTNQYGTCNCGNGYTIRPGITSANWGGINTETCQMWYQNANQTMIADVLRLYKNDNLAVTEFVMPDECTNTQDLKVEVMNLGYSNVSNYMIGYSINGTVQTPVSISNAINSEEEQTVIFKSSYTFTPSTSYDFKVWTYDPNSSSDEFVDNDTFVFKYKHAGSPSIPTASDINNCGNGSVKIKATASSSDSIIWYDAATNGKMLKLGEEYTTPFLTKSTTFYAEANAFKSSITTLSTGFHNYTMLSYDPSNFNGNMFDIKANNLISIHGIKVQALFGNTNPFYRVYVRDGSYVGNERSSSGWKLIFNDYLNTTGDNMNVIPVEFIPEPGKTYGVYVTTDPVSGEDQWAYYGNASYSNSDLTMSGGKYIYGLFASIGVYSPYMIDAEIMYSTACVSSARKAVTVNINPKPAGAELVKGSPYNGNFGLGLISQPDVVELNKDLTYELTKPYNYNNAGHGSTWAVTSVVLTSQYGVPVNPSLYTFTNPSSGSNGILKFKADNSVLDSNIVVNVIYKDLGPYFCDTLVKRVIHVAPTPSPDFSFANILCDKVDVVFGNKSKIHSGFMTYKWYFGDNDSSDSQEPTHLYSIFGSYNVRLVAKSSPWGILKDTTIVVNISEVPVAKFKSVNACEGNQVSFVNQTTIGSGTLTYDWSFGDNSANSNQINPKHSYPAPNGYPVTLTASSNGCTSQTTRNAYLFARPVADFTAPATPVCAGTEFELPNNSAISQGAMGAVWQFDDGDISTQFVGKHIYNTVNTHTVKLSMVSEFGCKDSITKSMNIKPSPTVDFTVDRLCSVDPSEFTNTSTEFSGITSVYTWLFSDGSSYSSKNVNKLWDIIGPKSVTLKSNLSNGCFNEITRSFNVLIQPSADFAYKDVCSGEVANFINKSVVSQGTVDYTWDFGDGSGTSKMYNPAHAFIVTSSNTFTVSLVTKVIGGCDDTARKIINVTEIPKCDFTFSGYYLSGNRGYKFTPANTGYAKYEWYFGEGGASTQSSPIYQYLYNGSFTVKLIATNAAGCSCEKTQLVNVIPSGITSLSDEKIQVYPNPANNEVSVNVDPALIGGSLLIYNSLGQIVNTQVITGSTTFINTADYSNGVYIVKVNIENKVFNTKIIVSH